LIILLEEIMENTYPVIPLYTGERIELQVYMAL
jgi:hypothetical protein